MKICKYCKKPISDNDVWNSDSEGNGYHHACLCEMEFRLRDRQIYDKGRADVLDKIRAEITDCLKALDEIEKSGLNIYLPNEISGRRLTYQQCLEFIDKYKGEKETT